jgi:PKD repeat protein/outer membrane murein-binding lipoprotein Lpp
MRTLIVSALLIGSLFISVPSAHALSVEDINAKVQALLAQIETLQKQLAQIVEQRQAALSDVQSAAARPACFRLDRILREGTRGDDVLTLQQVLKDKGFFAGDPTGYFGALTRAAVERFQAAQSIVSAGAPETTGYGLVGPATRRILWKCDDDATGTMRFSAAPQRGAAPLEVTFKTWVSGFRAPADSYTIDFGDGASEKVADCYAPADACIDAGVNTHTYQKDGAYTAILYHIVDPCGSNSYCKAAIHREAVAKVRISVGAVSSVNPEDDPQCKIWFDGCNTCSRTSPGSVGMCTMMACFNTGSPQRPYCKEYFGTTTPNKAPIIESFSGPASLKIGQQGEWKIKASDAENGQLTYDISWGDENGNVPASNLWNAVQNIIQRTTFTHSYATAGTYTVQVTVTDDKGASSRAALLVKVGDTAPTACTMEYAPVCGLKQVVCIKAPCNPVQQTYSNKCMLAGDGATFLYTGACRPQTGNPADDPQCKIWFDGCNTCSRTAPGTPGMCTMMACMTTEGYVPTPYCKEYFSNTSGNKPPVISSVSGPTILAVGQTGTWSIKATDPEKGALSYSIRWGDESDPPSSILFGSAGAPASLQASTFTHMYSWAGVFTVVVTVTDSDGASATATVTVNVGTVTAACTREYVPVCGRPAGCMPCNAPVGLACTAVCQLYPQQTYSNRCQLDAAGATFEHSGSC